MNKSPSICFAGVLFILILFPGCGSEKTPGRSEKHVETTPSIPEKKSDNAMQPIQKKSPIDGLSELIVLLKSEDPHERLKAVSDLLQIGKPAVPSLIATLEDKDLVSRGLATDILFELVDKDATSQLLRLLDHVDYYVRSRAVMLLGVAGDPRAENGLVKALVDSDASVRSSAATSLGNLEKISQIDPLFKAVRDEEGIVQKSAADALSRHASADVINLFISLIGDDEYESRDYIVYLLGSMKITAAVPSIINLMQSSSESMVLTTAIALEPTHKLNLKSRLLRTNRRFS